MRNKMILTAVSVLLSISLFGTLAFADSHGIIKYRQNVMKATAGHMGAIVDILKNGLPLEAHVSDHARSMLQNSKWLCQYFQKDLAKDAQSLSRQSGETGLNLSPRQTTLNEKVQNLLKWPKKETWKHLQNKSGQRVKPAVDATEISGKEIKLICSRPVFRFTFHLSYSFLMLNLNSFKWNQI